MIESKLKVKNANSGQLFRPDWVSLAECMPHSIEQPAQRKKSARGNDNPDGLKFKCPSIDHSRVILLISRILLVH